MSPSSTFGDGLTMPSKLKSFYQDEKPDIRINLTTKQRTYTTLDRIEGTVTILPHVDTSFNAIEIEFLGTSRTAVERLSTAPGASGRSEAFHQFLKLQQPGLQALHPQDLVLKAGKTYEFPFLFAIPKFLLPRVCQHSVVSDAVRDAHLRLPPTFGDKGLDSPKGFDDMALDMASIRYGIFARITELRTKGEDTYQSTVASKARRLRVIPAVEEQPPLDIQAEDTDYVMRREKTIRKGFLKGKMGSLVMAAAQPQSFKMRSYGNPESRLSTMATVMLRFDPLDDNTAPPKLGNLASKLKINTYFASTARNCFPSKQSARHDLTQGMHAEQITLSSRCVANVEWVKQQPCSWQLERRDSTISTNSLETGETPGPSETYKGGVYYTARVIVPITLPANKAFVPSFDTCLVSRKYTLKLDLGIASVGIGSNMEVKVPVQISSEDLVTDEFSRRDSVGAANDQEVDVDDVSNFFASAFEPRTIRIPSDSFIGRSRIGSQAPTVEPEAAGMSPPEDAAMHSDEAAVTRQENTTDAPPGYTPFAGTNVARMTHHRAMSVPVY